MNKNGDTPLVAVITRTKNRLILLERAIRSVQTQTYDDFIHVIVNDGGDSRALQELLDKYPASNRHVITNEKSVGLTVALNQGVKQSESMFIAILDDDDTWHCDFLKLTTEHLQETKAKGVVTVLDKVVEEIRDDKVVELSVERWRPDIQEVSLYGQCIDNYAPTVAFVYERAVYDELGGYDATLGAAEDWEFTIRFLLKYDIDFLHTEHALAYYHHRPDSSGDIGNSVFAGRDVQAYNLNRIVNRYLRDELKKGRLGVGYLMGKLRYEQQQQRQVYDYIDKSVVRLEGHVNYQAENVANNISNEINEVKKQTFGYVSKALGRRIRGEKSRGQHE